MKEEKESRASHVSFSIEGQNSKCILLGSFFVDNKQRETSLPFLKAI